MDRPTLLAVLFFIEFRLCWVSAVFPMSRRDSCAPRPHDPPFPFMGGGPRHSQHLESQGQKSRNFDPGVRYSESVVSPPQWSRNRL